MLRRLDLRAAVPSAPKPSAANVRLLLPRAAVDVDRALDAVRPVWVDVCGHVDGLAVAAFQRQVHPVHPAETLPDVRALGGAEDLLAHADVVEVRA